MCQAEGRSLEGEDKPLPYIQRGIPPTHTLPLKWGGKSLEREGQALGCSAPRCFLRIAPVAAAEGFGERLVSCLSF